MGKLEHDFVDFMVLANESPGFRASSESPAAANQNGQLKHEFLRIE
jgi:hypothetical protein